MPVSYQDLNAMAETLKAAFNGLAGELKQAIQEAEQEYGVQTPHMNGAEHLATMAQLADSITKIAAEMRAQRPQKVDPFGR